jgi:hypothetical protein
MKVTSKRTPPIAGPIINPSPRAVSVRPITVAAFAGKTFTTMANEDVSLAEHPIAIRIRSSREMAKNAS